jgi:hypothetical protein
MSAATQRLIVQPVAFDDVKALRGANDDAVGHLDWPPVLATPTRRRPD